MASFNSQARHLAPLDLIFSCSICQDTLSEIYAEASNDRGLRTGNDPDNGMVTKLWLTECAHLTCGKHLDGGGAPFYPQSQAPRAPCPLCSIEKGDTSAKAIYAINGASKGEYDENVPKTYFQTPPIKLGGNDPGMEALRFQYLSLLRYGSKKHATLSAVEDQLHEYKQYATAIEETMKKEQASLETIVSGLRDQLKSWNDRKPTIVRYMGAFTPMLQELQECRQRLVDLGQNVSSVDYALQLVNGSPSTLESPRTLVDDSTTVAFDNLDSRSRLARGSAADLAGLRNEPGTREPQYRSIPKILGQAQVAQQGEGSSEKRKRVESVSDFGRQARYAHGIRTFAREESRDAMPPPALPIKILRPAPPFVSNMNAQAFQPATYPGQTNPANLMTPSQEDSDFFVKGDLQGFRLGSDSEDYPTISSNHPDTAFHLMRPRGYPLQSKTENYEAHRVPARQIHDPCVQQSRTFEERESAAAVGINHTSKASSAVSRVLNYPNSYASSNHSMPSDIEGDHDGFPGPVDNLLVQNPTQYNGRLVNDGELDQNTLYVPARQQHTSYNISPSRSRISLLPPTPSLVHKNTPSRRSGIFVNARSSSSLSQLPASLRPHREPLGLRTNNIQGSLKSPFFSSRQNTSSIAQTHASSYPPSLQVPRDVRGSFQGHHAQARPQSTRVNQQAINGLSFISTPRNTSSYDGTYAKNLFSTSGRRCTQR